MLRGPFCMHCMKPVAWKEIVEPVTFIVHGLTITYKEHKAICMNCDNEVYVSSIDDKNVLGRQRAYLRALRGA